MLALELDRARRVAHKLYITLYHISQQMAMLGDSVQSALEDYEMYWQGRQAREN